MRLALFFSRLVACLLSRVEKELPPLESLLEPGPAQGEPGKATPPAVSGVAASPAIPPPTTTVVRQRIAATPVQSSPAKAAK